MVDTDSIFGSAKVKDAGPAHLMRQRHVLVKDAGAADRALTCEPTPPPRGRESKTVPLRAPSEGAPPSACTDEPTRGAWAESAQPY